MNKIAPCVAIALSSCAMAAPSPRPAELRVSNSHLVATCFAGQPVSARPRSWRVIDPTSMTLTMRNEPRPGVNNHDPGIAVVSFTPEADHEYEIEVRGDAAAFSLRVWKKGEWRPVVRDRTTDRIVSSEPKWIESGCGS
jgi:hypothetical protein